MNAISIIESPIVAVMLAILLGVFAVSGKFSVGVANGLLVALFFVGTLGLRRVPDIKLAVAAILLLASFCVFVSSYISPSLAPQTVSTSPELEVSLVLNMPPFGRHESLQRPTGPQAGDPDERLRTAIFKDALLVNKTASKMLLTFELSGKLDNGTSFSAPENGPWDRFFKNSNVAFQYFHGPVDIGANSSLQGDLAFTYNLTPHDAEFNFMATTITVTDQLSDKKRTFSTMTLLEPWMKSHVKIVPKS